MENVGYTVLAIIVLFFICIFLSPNSYEKEINETEQLPECLLKKQRKLDNMNFCISEIQRISGEKTKAIKAHDWELLKKLKEEEAEVNIYFNSINV